MSSHLPANVKLKHPRVLQGNLLPHIGPLLFNLFVLVSEFFAGQQLAQVEQQINAQNELFKEGKSTFYEKLNEFSDLSKAQFEKEKEGAKIPRTSEGRSLGAKLPPKSGGCGSHSH